jgi:hypothetical protein
MNRRGRGEIGGDESYSGPPMTLGNAAATYVQTDC